MRDPAVILEKFLSVQVCVPEHWTDEEVKDFAEAKYSCGTSAGWSPRSDRVPCADGGDMVHVVLTA